MNKRTQLAITAGVVAGGFAALAMAERRRPLRVQRQRPLPRVARNLTIGALALAASRLVRIPQQRKARGLLRVLEIPRPLQTIASIALLDYTLWWWHRWNHEMPLLWRFHRVHHLERDMDVSTGLRFHFGEQFLSQFYRAAQVRIIGAPASAVWLWQTLLFASILFHHSNLRLPIASESRLVRWIVTPRMHGIHHSNRAEDERTNYASLLTCWDALHETLRLDVPQEKITIGTAGYAEEGLVNDLVLPFE